MKKSNLKELKEEGHYLIERIAAKRGISKDRVYRLLQEKMGFAVHDSAHFSHVHTVRDALKMLEALRELYHPQTVIIKRVEVLKEHYTWKEILNITKRKLKHHLTNSRHNQNT